MGVTQFLIEFRHATGAEILCADRIHADGKGKLVLYRGTDQFRSLDLARIRDLRIWSGGLPAAAIH